MEKELKSLTNDSFFLYFVIVVKFSILDSVELQPSIIISLVRQVTLGIQN